MKARRRLAIVGAALLLILTGCALFQKPPSAGIDYVQDSPAGFTFLFKGFDPDGSVVSIDWEFGDGATDTGRSVSHAFPATRDYCVRVTAKDDSGLYDSALVTVHASREIPVSMGESIQAAIDSAETGATVMLAEAFFYEEIDFRGKAITVRSADLTRPAILMQRDLALPASEGAVVSFVSGEGRNSILQGVTLRGYRYASHWSGGAVIACDSSPTIDGCTIEQFYMIQGGGVATGNAAPLITNCTIRDCQARLNGGAIYCQGPSFPDIVGNRIESNRAELGGGIYFCLGGDAPMANQPHVSANSFIGNVATGSPKTSHDEVGGAVHIAVGVEIVNEGNAWSGNSPYDLRYDEPR